MLSIFSCVCQPRGCLLWKTLNIREIQIKTTMRYHLSEWLTLTTQATTDVGEVVEKGELFCTAGGNANGHSHSGKHMEVPQKVETRATLWPSNYTTRYLSKGYKNADSKGHMHPNVYSNTIGNSQTMERAQMPIDWWMDKEDVVYIYTMEYYSAMKENEILPFATTWMELECIMLSKISHSEI